MTTKELSIVLRELACSQPTPLCRQWTEEWADDTDIDALIDKYVRGQDFCIVNDYPPLDFIRKNFGREDLHRHHIYLDEEVDIREAESGTWIFLGKCSGEICFGWYTAGNVYVRHTSSIRVTAMDAARVFLSLYDDAGAEATAQDNAVIRRYDRRK